MTWETGAASALDVRRVSDSIEVNGKLLRHLTWRIPSGQSIAADMGALARTETELSSIHPHLVTSTALWYYVLKQAEAFEDGNSVRLERASPGRGVHRTGEGPEGCSRSSRSSPQCSGECPESSTPFDLLMRAAVADNQ